MPQARPGTIGGISTAFITSDHGLDDERRKVQMSERAGAHNLQITCQSSSKITWADSLLELVNITACNLSVFLAGNLLVFSRGRSRVVVATDSDFKARSEFGRDRASEKEIEIGV